MSHARRVLKPGMLIRENSTHIWTPYIGTTESTTQFVIAWFGTTSYHRDALPFYRCIRKCRELPVYEIQQECIGISLYLALHQRCVADYGLTIIPEELTL